MLDDDVEIEKNENAVTFTWDFQSLVENGR